jgi:hypothetical protein
MFLLNPTSDTLGQIPKQLSQPTSTPLNDRPLRDAGVIAGTHFLRFINEAITVAIAYSLDWEVTRACNVLIFYLGGASSGREKGSHENPDDRKFQHTQDASRYFPALQPKMQRSPRENLFAVVERL